MNNSSVKPPLDSVEPLVLRPPVGSEVRDSAAVRFRTFFDQSHDLLRRRRLLCRLLLFGSVVLLGLIVLLFILSTLGFVPGWFAYHHHHMSSRFLHHPSGCRIIVPTMRLRMTEMLTGDENMFNVTLFNRGPHGEVQTTRILHLCKDQLTTIRTDERCYIRPMDEEWRRVCSGSYAKQMQNGLKLHSAVEARLTNHMWFIDAAPPSVKVIHNSYIFALCDRVPAFWLVSDPPRESYAVDYAVPDADRSVTPSPPRTAGPPSEHSPNGDGETSEVLKAIAESDRSASSSSVVSRSELPDTADQHSQMTYSGTPLFDLDDLLASLLEDEPTGTRVARDVETQPNETTTLYDDTQDRDLPNHCHAVSSVFEGTPIPPESETKEVLITQDRIASCVST